MKALIQRVTYASVSVDEKVVGEIEKGLLIFVGISREDTQRDIEILAGKIPNLRIFKDENDKMNKSALDLGLSALVISQFTLCADVSKGNRPSFTLAAVPIQAEALYLKFIKILSERGIGKVESGIFGENMQIKLLNDGPVTIIYDSKDYMNNKLKIEKLPLYILSTNCYILCDESTGEGAVIDPADCNDALLNKIDETGIKKLKYILLTHGHFDHVHGVYDLKQKFPEAQICISEEDEIFISTNEMKKHFTYFKDELKTLNADVLLKDGDVLKVGSSCLKIMETPGHSKGSLCFVGESIIFSGDTLFCKDVGRTDFYGGDYETLMSSLKKLYDLKGDYVVYPGHSENTTLQNERVGNRYMRKFK